jgi:radical SAM superfamily enzyme YgiQ (UPF0313 family)
MRVAGVYPQNTGTDLKIQHAVSEPYGLEMILATAKQEGHDAELFLPIKENQGAFSPIEEEEYTDAIAGYRPDIAGFSLYTCQYPAGKRIAAALKKRLPGLITVAGNRYPTYLEKRIEEPFDVFAAKEGEETFKELLFAVEQNQDLEKVKGISFQKNGNAVFTGVRKRNFNLDALPDALRFPVILNQVYKSVSLPPLSENPHYAIMEYSRCCYNNCSFCDKEGFWGNAVTFRSPQRVVDEMFELKEKGVDIFYFIDLNFTAYPEKAEELCNEMTERRLDASWYCMSNVSTADKNSALLSMMKEAGCFKVAWGVESTDDNSLIRMNKSTRQSYMTHEQCARVLQESMDCGLLNQGYYIIGFPWENEESILRDSLGLRDMPLHQLNIGIFTPVPMSRFFSDMQEQGYKFDPDLTMHDRNNLVYNHRTLTNSAVKALQSQIYDDFYRSLQYKERLRTTCQIDQRFARAFNDYFFFSKKDARA